MKSYRENELKFYVISCIFVFLWIHFQDNAKVLNLWIVLNPLIISPVFYIFTFLLDSVYSSDIKFKIVFWNRGMPSRYVFDEIASKGYLPWFTKEEAKKAYEKIYDSMPNTQERYSYQAREWYKIYNKYQDKGIKPLEVNAIEYRMFRDINIATINLTVLYLLYYLLYQRIYWEYIIFLLLASILTNISARNKGKRWIYNVIAYDINAMSSTAAQENANKIHEINNSSKTWQ